MFSKILPYDYACNLYISICTMQICLLMIQYMCIRHSMRFFILYCTESLTKGFISDGHLCKDFV